MYTQHKGFNKAFDKAAHGFMTGNVFSDLQASGYVRAFNQTECNGFTDWKEGELQQFDLKPFDYMPKRVERSIIQHAHDKSVIWYAPRHIVNGSYRVHGYFITDINGIMLDTFFTANHVKSDSVVIFAIKSIVKGYQL